MNKNELIMTIKNAREAHEKWVDFAVAIVDGAIIDKTLVPIMATDCQFGIWYYSNKQAFEKLYSFRSIENPHIVLHDTYREIFNLVTIDKNAQKLALAKDKVQILQQASKRVIQYLGELEGFLFVMPAKQMDSFINEAAVQEMQIQAPQNVTVSPVSLEIAGKAERPPQNNDDLPAETHQVLQKLLVKYIGPVASLIYDEIKQKHLDDRATIQLAVFIKQLSIEVSASQKEEFQECASKLLKSASK